MPNRGESVEFHNFFRTACLNQDYYGERLRRISRVVIVRDVLLALTSSSAIGAWAIWKNTPWGETVWAGLSGVSAVIAAVAPAFRLDIELKRLSALAMKYRALVLETKAIIDDIQSTRAIPADLGSIQSGLRAKYASIAVDDDNPPRKKLLEEVQGAVQRHYPAGLFWTPTGEGGTIHEIRVG